MDKTFLSNRKPIKIDPVDVDVWVRANSVHLYNEFKNMGVIRRSEFIEMVQAHDEKYLADPGPLSRFWQGRHFSQALNQDLQNVLNEVLQIS